MRKDLAKLEDELEANMSKTAASLECKQLVSEQLQTVSSVIVIIPFTCTVLRSQKWIIRTYICLLQCGQGFSENLRILW